MSEKEIFENEEVLVYTLTDDEGNENDFELLASVELDGKTLAVGIQTAVLCELEEVFQGVEPQYIFFCLDGDGQRSHQT